MIEQADFLVRGNVYRQILEVPGSAQDKVLLGGDGWMHIYG